MTWLKNAAALQGSRLAQQIGALLSIAILARAVEPSGIGLYAALLALAVVVQAVFGFGLEDIVLARGPALGGDTPLARAFYRRALFLRLLPVGLSFLCAAIVLGCGVDGILGATSLELCISLIYAGANSIATLGSAIQAARAQAVGASMLDTTWALGTCLTFVVLAITEHLAVSSALLGTTALQCFISIGYLLLLTPLFDRAKTRVELSVRDLANYWLNGLLSVGSGKNSDVLLIAAIGASTYETGLYNSAFAVSLLASTFLLQGVGTMTYVAMGNAYSVDKEVALPRAWRFAVLLGGLLSLPPLAFCLIFPAQMLTLLFGASFSSASGALIILCSALSISRILGGGANQAVLFLARRERFVLIARSIAVLINLSLDILLYLHLGIAGVALASSIGLLIIVVAELGMGKRLFSLRVPLREGLAVFGIFLVASAAAAVVNIFVNNSSVWPSAAMSVVFGAILTLLVKPLRLSELSRYDHIAGISAVTKLVAR